MKSSISRRIFLTTIIAFMVVFAVQWAVISSSFNTVYRNSILSSVHSELRDTISRYKPSKVFEVSSEISDYVNATGNPVMVVNDAGEICDRDILRRMRTITLSTPDSGDIIVPCGYLFTIYGTNAPLLTSGRRVYAELLPLGDSDIYDPVNIRFGGLDFRSRKNKALYIPEVEDKILSISSVIITTNNIFESDDALCRRAEALYDAVKVPLGLGTDVASSVEALNGKSVTIQGYDYRFICESEIISGTRYHFVAISRVLITGFERNYINRFLYMTYLVIACVVVTVALLLSRYISRPLEKLSTATQKIAALDFSETPVSYKGDDEIGRLTDNVNTMSDNLENALIQLESASKLARENEARMQRLLEDTAHEFKTPLGIASGYFDIINMGIDEQKKEEYYGIIQAEIEGLADIVDETITLAKLQSGYWNVAKEECNLSDVLSFAAARLEQRASDEGFTLDITDDDTLVLCDKSKILLVVSNFLSNAFKYSNERRLIRITSEDAGDGKLMVTVANSGSMKKEDEALVWDRNYSTAEAGPARLASQGIGLNIVKKILEAHGSEYGVYQEDGMVCFWFTLDKAAGRSLTEEG